MSTYDDVEFESAPTPRTIDKTSFTSHEPAVPSIPSLRHLWPHCAPSFPLVHCGSGPVTIAKRFCIPGSTLYWANKQAQCKGDKYLVKIEDVPVKSKLVALIELPQELRSGSDVELCALYLTASGHT
ncbi:hypothetical protein L211DRAFT_853666 [Terfezia boudieri ATCC MYA-4762]|uniref:Uncharacterized protein n=1 Tax=Terfezia boudieri ATCC MYA-4762 TaxID=1051890 RepID=A0A3N4L7S5_9PEZI|nr:hypothetical protein L211DRAFT_853666 [Terfezia boudieri ATCC MYA-4762]